MEEVEYRRTLMLKLWLKLAFALDAARVMPRVFVGVYLWQLHEVIQLYVACEPKTWDLSLFITAYSALSAPLLKWYMDSGVDWTRFTDNWFRMKEVGRDNKPPHPDRIPPVDCTPGQ